MKDIIQGTIGNPLNIITKMPSLIKATFDPQMELGYKKIRAGLSMMTINKYLPKPKNGTLKNKNVKIPMSDGINLCADITRPKGNGRFPTLIIMHPYGRFIFMLPAHNLAQQGFAVVHVDERGRFDSDGNFYLFKSGQTDGIDLCKWIVKQPWSNSQIGGFGSSMLGINQWQFSCNNPYITSFTPNMGCLNLQELLHFGGTKPLSALILVGNWIGNKKSTSFFDLIHWLPSLYKKLPLKNVIHPSLGRLDWFDHTIDKDSYDPIFSYLSTTDKYEKISAPSFSITGWYDMLCDTALNDFIKVRLKGKEKAKESKIVIGPWYHYGAPNYKQLDEYIRYSGLETVKWYNHILKGEPNGVENWPAVRYFVTGADVWRDSDTWPPKNTKKMKFYLYRNGNGLASRTGVLLNQPSDEIHAPVSFAYNPANPVPTCGGDHLFFNVGIKDQAHLEKRSDILTYRSEKLNKSLEIAGPINVSLYVSTDAPDTDFTAKLVDACPDGKIWNIRDGIVRLKYRKFQNQPIIDEPAPVDAGKIYKITINLGHMGHRFKEGHQIGLHISSSNFPKFDRNLNTGEDPFTSTTMRKANQKIYHDAENISYIELTVLSS